MRSHRENYHQALDVAVVALHRLAAQWEHVSVGIATQLRKIADRLASKANYLRTHPDAKINTLDE